MSDPAAQAMQTLTAQYYNLLVKALKLDPNTFQLAQGNIALPLDSQGLWQIMDAIPPTSISQCWSTGGYNSFSSNYGELLSAIQSPSSTNFQLAMGDYYVPWTTYLQANPPPTGTSMVAWLTQWCQNQGMSPAQVRTCTSAWTGAADDPIVAGQMLYAAAGGAGALMAYTQDITDVDAAIGMSSGASASLNTLTQSSVVTNTWAKGAVEGVIEDFFGGASATSQSSTSLLLTAGVSMEISFNSVATIPVGPLASGTMVSGPTTYQPWYVSGALSEAYTDDNTSIWVGQGKPTWDSFFGSTGSMQQALGALYVVDGITINLTSINEMTESECAQVEADMAGGWFPFFGAEGVGGWTYGKVNLNNGIISTSCTCLPGNGSIQILGCSVLPIQNVFAAQAVRAARRKVLMSRGSRQPVRVARRVGIDNVVTAVVWSTTANIGLAALGVSAKIQGLIRSWVNSWAEQNGDNWALGATQTYTQTTPNFVATAAVTAIAPGNNRTVTVQTFV